MGNVVDSRILMNHFMVFLMLLTYYPWCRTSYLPRATLNKELATLSDPNKCNPFHG